MYFLFKMGIFQPAMFVYRRVLFEDLMLHVFLNLGFHGDHVMTFQAGHFTGISATLSFGMCPGQVGTGIRGIQPWGTSPGANCVFNSWHILGDRLIPLAPLSWSWDFICNPLRV